MGTESETQLQTVICKGRLQVLGRFQIQLDLVFLRRILEMFASKTNQAAKGNHFSFPYHKNQSQPEEPTPTISTKLPMPRGVQTGDLCWKVQVPS